MTLAQPVLQARGIRKVYESANEELEILRHVDLDVDANEIVAITGVSGVGKSTLLHILGALDRPTAGSLTIQGQDVFGLAEPALSGFRNRQVGFVFQFHHLLPEFTAVENVLLPAMISGAGSGERVDEAIALLERVGLGDRLDHRPGELSGGECQRVAVVRALIMRPAVVLADEPTGNLDTETSNRLHDMLMRLAKEHGQAFVVMTHDDVLAKSMDRVGHIENGELR